MKAIREYDRGALLQGLEAGADVWWVRPETVSDPALLADCAAILSGEEVARHDRFHFADDRHLYLVSHAMLRRVLSAYGDVEPSTWVFSAGEHGRPGIGHPLSSLRFNLTHTRGLAACVVTRGVACGVDAERVSPRRHAMGIARRMFADAELCRLEALEGTAFLERFFTLWTLREAWCKARGTGLAGSGRAVWFDDGAGDGWQIHFAPGHAGGGRWQLDVQAVPGGHRLAVAVEAAGGQARAFRYRPFMF